MAPKGSKTEGNTETSVIRQSSKKDWVFTLNNYTTEEVESLGKLFGSIGSYIYGFEVGDEGTPHLQGFIKLHTKMRLNEMKDINKRIHWEVKGKFSTMKQAEDYCKKEGNWVSNYLEELKLIAPRDWQLDVLKIIEAPADERKIYWFWETVGNVGKSSLCKYICAKHKGIYIDEGKKCDIINIIFNCDITSKSVIVIDIPRSNGNKISYKAIEQIKNGMICNTKYETGMKLFNSPHVLIFANEAPDESKLSADRWSIRNLNCGYTVNQETEGEGRSPLTPSPA